MQVDVVFVCVELYEGVEPGVGNRSAPEIRRCQSIDGQAALTPGAARPVASDVLAPAFSELRALCCTCSPHALGIVGCEAGSYALASKR